VFDKLELVAVDAVEDDMDADDPRRAYRITAEIVAPIVANERCVGVISVHEVRGERQWAPEEVAAVTSATAQAHEILYPGRRSEASS
jgi:GAF domain-containing protein